MDGKARKKNKKRTQEFVDKSQKLKFCGSSILNESILSKMVFLWILIPVILYFSHIILILVEFNDFMESILML